MLNKYIDKLFFLILLISPATVFFAKGGSVILYSIFTLGILRLITTRDFKSKFIGIMILGIAMYNYSIIMGKSSYFTETLTKTSIVTYFFCILTLLMIFYIFSDYKKIMDINKMLISYYKVIYLEVIAAQIVLVIMFITGLGFKAMNGERNFIGLYNSPHTCGYSLFFMIIVIEWINVVTKKEDNILFYLPIFLSLFTGARTPALISIFAFCIFKFGKKPKYLLKGKLTLKSFVVFNMLLSAIVLLYRPILNFILESPIIEKFIKTSSSGNLTSGRNIFWADLIARFSEDFTVSQKLFGTGIYNTMILNQKDFGMSIWAHSDFIDILISYGVIVLVVYVLSYLGFFLKIFKNTDRKFMVAAFAGLFMLLSGFNGLVNYSSMISIICYIGLLFIARDKYDDIEYGCEDV